MQTLSTVVCQCVCALLVSAASSAAGHIPGDTDGSGAVDASDVLNVLAAWGSNDSRADIDNDGKVDEADLFAVLQAWGQSDGDSSDKIWAISHHLKRAWATGEGLEPAAAVPPAIPLENPPPDGPDIRITPENDRTQSENSVAVHPLNSMVILNSNNSTDWPVTTLFGTSWFLSTDGGQTWTGESAGPDGVANNGDPAAAIDLDGKLYIGYINSAGGQGVSFSTNMGTDWTHVDIVATVPGLFDLLDKNHLTVDNVAASPFADRVYSAWTEFIAGGPNDNDIVLSFSTDGGNSWSALANLSDGVAAGNHNQGVNIQTGPGGEVYVCWSIYDAFPADETAIGFNSSTNGGATWTGESRIITNIRGIRLTTLPNESTRANSFPSMVVDVSGGPRDGWIFIFWTNIGVPGVNTGDADIYMSRSTDGGGNWSAPVRVNDDATTNAQWFPWATCDPVNGDLSVIFYDRRDDAGDLLTTAYVAHSTDGGTTWTNLRVGDVQFTPAPIPGLAVGYMGDYLGIASLNCSIYPVWGDNRTTPFTTYVSPIIIDETPPEIACPPDVTVTCGESTDPDELGFATAVDDCDPDPVIDFEDVEIPTTCPADPVMFVIERTWTATDASGNFNTCVQLITVEKVVLDLDIKPGSCPNSYNRGSNGVLPVGLLGTADFDVSTIDISTILISRADCIGGAVAPIMGPPGPHPVLADVGTPFKGDPCDCHELEGDGIIDWSLKFSTPELVEPLELDTLPAGSMVELVVSGQLDDGCGFIATDCVRLVRP
ncbi:MAG: hypothetical protein IIA27_07460 [Gemmatimonadetes bacterium]|nr:hypothetical protein [Gemmatimonadota bacterium]